MESNAFSVSSAATHIALRCASSTAVFRGDGETEAAAKASSEGNNGVRSSHHSGLHTHLGLTPQIPQLDVGSPYLLERPLLIVWVLPATERIKPIEDADGAPRPTGLGPLGFVLLSTYRLAFRMQDSEGDVQNRLRRCVVQDGLVSRGKHSVLRRVCPLSAWGNR